MQTWGAGEDDFWPAFHSDWGHFHPWAVIWLIVPGSKFCRGFHGQSVHIAHGSACQAYLCHQLLWKHAWQNGTGNLQSQRGCVDAPACGDLPRTCLSGSVLTSMEHAKHCQHCGVSELQEKNISYWRCTKKSYCLGGIPDAQPSSMRPQC